MKQHPVTQRFVKCHDALKEKGMIPSSRQFALALGVKPQNLNEILKGRRDATVDMLQGLIEVFSINPDYLFACSREMFLVEKAEEPQTSIEYVPYSAHAGGTDQFFEALNNDSLMTFSLPGYNPRGKHRCFDVIGDSMEPTIYAADKLICSKVSADNHYAALKDNYVYVVITESEILVKRVENKLKAEGYLILKSDNSYYRPELIPGNHIREVWKVNMKLSHFMPDPKNVQNAFHQQIGQLKTTIETQKDSISTLNRSIEALLRKNR